LEIFRISSSDGCPATGTCLASTQATMRPALDPTGHRVPRTKPTCLLHTWRPHRQRPFALVLHLHQHESSHNLHLQYLAKNQSTQLYQSLITQGGDHPPVLEPHMVLRFPRTTTNSATLWAMPSYVALKPCGMTINRLPLAYKRRRRSPGWGGTTDSCSLGHFRLHPRYWHFASIKP
jgi:hypothetical protein